MESFYQVCLYKMLEGQFSSDKKEGIEKFEKIRARYKRSVRRTRSGN
jgi:hypothetical protein